jgi:hypothetical protein
VAAHAMLLRVFVDRGLELCGQLRLVAMVGGMAAPWVVRPDYQQSLAARHGLSASRPAQFRH